MSDKITAIRLKRADGTYTDQIPIWTTADNVAYRNNYTLHGVIGDIAVSTDGNISNQLQILNNKYATMMAAVGGPQIAATASAMTDHNKIYVYTGNESGYETGKWYYWDTTEQDWMPGGTYQSVGVDTDATLSITGVPADAKTTGDKINFLTNQLQNFNSFDIWDGTITHVTKTANNVSFSWSGDVCTVSTNGAASATTTDNLISQYTDLPQSVVCGKTYYVKYKTSSPDVILRIGFRKNSSSQTTIDKNFYEDSFITIPDDVTQWIVFLFVRQGTTISPAATVSDIHFLSAIPNQNILAEIDNQIDIVTKYNSMNLLQGYYRKQNYIYPDKSSGICYEWITDQTGHDQCKIYGATSENQFSANAYILRYKIPNFITPNTPLFLKYKTTKTQIKCRILYYTNSNDQVASKTQFYYNDSIIYIPQGIKQISLNIYVDAGVSIGTETGTSYEVVSDLYLFAEKSNQELTKDVVDLQNITTYNIFNKNLLTKTTNTKNGVHFSWLENDICKIYTDPQGATATAINHLINTVNSGSLLPADVQPGKTYIVHFSSPNPNVQLIIQFANTSGVAIKIQKIISNKLITIPDNAIAWHVYLQVAAGTIISQNSPVIIDGNLKLLPAFTNKELMDKSNLLEFEKPLYVAVGDSTTQGAVHYYNQNQENSDHSTTSIYNYPNYTGQVLGLDVVNLAVGGSGYIARVATRNVNGVYYYDNNNFMDVIYNQSNDSIFKKANLITISTGYGNDANLKLGSTNTRTRIPIGEYNDYYPFDEEGYNISDTGNTPAVGQLGVKAMIEEKGATYMGCINWCIKYLGDHYPLAQLILINGRFSYNEESARGGITIKTDSSGKKSLDFTPRGTLWYEVSEKMHRLAKTINIPLIDMQTDGMPYTYYSSEAKDENEDYILFSTIKENGVKVKNNHPTDLGYLLFARFLAGRIASYYYR